jgi:hypothetical protein
MVCLAALDLSSRLTLLVELDGVVEYKSLPSGLHHCESDLVYFVHEQYAGISAFANRSAHESERNAHFAAVGILVPLTYGRLGRSWLHAHQLRRLVAYAFPPYYCQNNADLAAVT